MLDLFQDEEPSIYKVRDCLMRLSKNCPRPNQQIQGDWIIFWASREGCVDKLFGTGMTEPWWMEMQEYLIRIGSRKEGRVVEAAEVIRRVGPFPNQSNSLKGTYSIAGTNSLQFRFTEIKTDDEKEIEGCKEKVIDVDVIYSSANMVALQYEDTSGECDFYVLTPVEDLTREVNRLVGAERARYFFN